MVIKSRRTRNDYNTNVSDVAYWKCRLFIPAKISGFDSRHRTKNFMNKSLVFQRAWNEHKIKLKHNCSSVFSDCLKTYFRIAKMLGKNFK